MCEWVWEQSSVSLVALGAAGSCVAAVSVCVNLLLAAQSAPGGLPWPEIPVPDLALMNASMLTG